MQRRLAKLLYKEFDARIRCMFAGMELTKLRELPQDRIYCAPFRAPYLFVVQLRVHTVQDTFTLYCGWSTQDQLASWTQRVDAPKSWPESGLRASDRNVPVFRFPLSMFWTVQEHYWPVVDRRLMEDVDAAMMSGNYDEVKRVLSRLYEEVSPQTISESVLDAISRLQTEALPLVIDSLNLRTKHPPK